MNLIECNDITLSYDHRQVVGHLSFSVEKGSCLCIVGENGSGKSTLLKALVGLIKPEQGTITFAKGFTRMDIGYLPQRTEVQQDFPASVEEVVRSGLLNRKKKGFFFGRQEKEIALRVMDELELNDLAGLCFRELSGGQQQRVLLARALTSADEMLVLDEPATGLDPLATAELYEIIARKHREGMTIAMVTHDMEAAIANADVILHLDYDRSFFGTTAQYLASDLYRHIAGGTR